MKETTNRAFEEMRKVALARLLGREPIEIAKKSGVTYAEDFPDIRC